MKTCKPIFYFTARIPLVQIVTILLTGILAAMLAVNTRTGTYIGFDAEVKKDSTRYLIEIPAEYADKIPHGSNGKWCFHKTTGKRNAVIQKNGLYMLDISGLDSADTTMLDIPGCTVYVEFQVSTHHLLSWR